MAESENARIDQLPLGTPNIGDYFVFRSMGDGITKRCLVDTFIPSETQNFEWVTDNDPGYAEDEVVTYGGVWWQSLINDNLNIIPGTDPDSWMQISRASSWTFHQGGAYVEDKVVVLKRIGTDIYLFELNEATPRPFASSDFDAEIAAGHWRQFGILEYIALDTSGAGDITINARKLKEIMLKGSDNIVANRNWLFSNTEKLAVLPSIRVYLTAGFYQQFPAGTKCNNALWDSVTRRFTPLDSGNYEIYITYDQVEYWMRIDGPFV